MKDTYNNNNFSDDDDSRSNETFAKIVGWTLVLLALCFFVFATQGCNTERRLTRISLNHMDAAAIVSNKLFPPITKTVTNTEYKEGATVWQYDTVVVNCDSILGHLKNEGSSNSSNPVKYVRIPCPPSAVRVDSFIRTITVTNTDTKQIAALTAQASKAEAKVNALQKGRNNWRIIALGCMGLIVARIAWFLFKTFGKIALI